jgi:hypothetical protein
LCDCGLHQNPRAFVEDYLERHVFKLKCELLLALRDVYALGARTVRGLYLHINGKTKDCGRAGGGDLSLRDVERQSARLPVV